MIPFRLINGNFFFVDIVGLSSLAMPVEEQISRINALNSIISSTEVFRNTPKDLMIFLPAGDGLAIGFLQGPELPLMLAIELHRKLNDYNRDKTPADKLAIRIGMNDGAVYVVDDAYDRPNVWGPGIIMARRVMDIGDEGHILLSERMAKTLNELSDEYNQMIYPQGMYRLKHDLKVLLYSAYGDDYGNKEKPTKNLFEEDKWSKVINDWMRDTRYTKIDVTLTIKDPKTMLTHHTRTYHIRNISREPIAEVVHGVSTDVEKSFADLHFRTTDEKGRDLELASIDLDKPMQKQFTTKFNLPIAKGQNNRSYTLEYDVEEPDRYFENFFNINCDKYLVSIVYPSNNGITPIFYNVDVEKDTRTELRTQPKVKKFQNGLMIAAWSKSSVQKTECFGVKW
jgi:hypothetical protein